MVQEHRCEYACLWAAIESIAPTIGCVPQTHNEWVRKQQVDTGLRDGITSEERDRMISGIKKCQLSGAVLVAGCTRYGSDFQTVTSIEFTGVVIPPKNQSRQK